MQKLTNSDRAHAYLMRLNGMSFQEIADHFGVSKQCIAQLLPCSGRSYQRNRVPERCVYVGIREYMIRERMTYARLAALCGLGAATVQGTLTGKNSPVKKTIDAILEATGLSYEEAFRRDPESKGAGADEE